jgi:L-2-hydroxyglutarate oxidase LhgO
LADDHVQTIVIGAGVVGLACGAELARAGRQVLVLEREPAIGQGVSSRNSEVIHAGIYYPAGSLRARVCVEGKQMLYRYCQERAIDARAIGKLIVATSDEEIDTLQSLHSRAIGNGVNDLQWLDADQAQRLEPRLSCVAALHSPSTGIIDSHQLMVSLQGDIENADGMVVLRTPVTDIDCETDHIQVTTGGDSDMTLSCDELINCAGLAAVETAQRMAGVPADSIPQAIFARGNYFRLQGAAPFSRLIYPAPVTGGLGVHLTLDLGGLARFGPDVEFLPDSDSQALTYAVDPARADSFYAAIRRYWPGLPDQSLLPDYAGIRPKISRSGNSPADFEISGQTEHGRPGLINLYGIESPGLTSSLAIAALVREALDDPQALPQPTSNNAR